MEISNLLKSLSVLMELPYQLVEDEVLKKIVGSVMRVNGTLISVDGLVLSDNIIICEHGDEHKVETIEFFTPKTGVYKVIDTFFILSKLAPRLWRPSFTHNSYKICKPESLFTHNYYTPFTPFLESFIEKNRVTVYKRHNNIYIYHILVARQVTDTTLRMINFDFYLEVEQYAKENNLCLLY